MLQNLSSAAVMIGPLRVNPLPANSEFCFLLITHPLRTFWTQIRPDIMIGRTVGHSDGISEGGWGVLYS